MFKIRFFLSLSFISFTVSALCFGSEEEQLGNFKNPQAVQEVLNGERKIANAAWWGFDRNDSTNALQSAINSGAQKVLVPYMGSDWLVRPITLAGNQEVVFDPGIVITAKKGEFRGKYDSLFSARDVNNITLRGYGATLRMRKADYQSSKYVKSEWRHALTILSSSNVKVLGLRLVSSGGDGIFIGQKKGRVRPPCKSILIRDCICEDNHRQGISVTCVDTLRIDNCILKNTRGTSPQAGIDLEPSNSKSRLINVVISNCISENNVGHGFVTNISALDEKSREVSMLFFNCYSKNNGAGFGVNATNNNGPAGVIEFRNCVCEGSNYSGMFAHLKLAASLNVRFENSKCKNVGKKHNSSPVSVTLRKKKDGSKAPAVEFVNCSVYDKNNRPFLKVRAAGTEEGVYDVKGNINVHNPYGAMIDSAKTDKPLALKVNFFKTQK